MAAPWLQRLQARRTTIRENLLADERQLATAMTRSIETLRELENATISGRISPRMTIEQLIESRPPHVEGALFFVHFSIACFVSL